MTTNIVEQMLVELGLDASKYTAQADKAVKTNKQLEKSLTDTEKASKETEKAQKKLGDETEKAANRFNLFETTLLRATGLEKWVNDIVDAEDAAKSMAANLGLSQSALAKWQNAAKNAGGDGKGIVGLFEKLNELTVNQQASGKKNAILESLGVDLVGTDGKARNLNKVVFELSENLRKLNRPHAYQVAKKLGMDDSTANLMMQGHNGIQQLMKKPYTEVTKAEDEIAKLIKSVQNGIKIIGKFTTVLLGNTGLLKLANDAAKANMQLTNLSTNLRVNATSLQSWQNAAKTGGGTAEGMTASLTGIKQAMNGLVMFGDASMLPYFNALGVSMVDSYGKVRDMNSVMLDLADAFSKMPRDQAYTLAKQMGLDDGTFNTLVQGRKELQEILDIQKRMYHSDGKAIARSRELTKQQAILSAHWQSMKQLVGDALTPILLTLIKVVNSFFEFLQRHEKVIKAVFQTAAIVIGMLLIPTLLSAGRALLAFIAPFTPLIRLMGALGIAINPVIAAVTALAGAFVLLYDDYDTWAKGGKSLFDWGAFSAGIKDSKMSVDTLSAAFSNLVDAVKNNTIPTLKGYAEILGKLVRGDFTGAAKQAKQMIDNYSDIATGIIADAMGEKKEDVADFIGESMYRLFHGGKDYFEQNSTQKPVKANASRGSTAKDSVTESKGSFAQELNAAMDKYGIKDANARASFLSNVDNETGGGRKFTENLNYKFARWAGINSNTKKWAKNHSEAEFKRLTAQDKANIMYANMIGNKNPNDGWTFRGRGGMQLTGRANYQAYADYSGRQDIMSNPDLIATDPRLAADSAAWYFMKRSKAGKQAMAGNIAGARKTVNGGYIGMDNYKNLYTQYLQGKGRLSKNNMKENAAKAQSMIANVQRMQTTSVAHNDNRRYVNVNIPNMNVQTSSNTVSGNTVTAMKEVQNYMFNQLGVSMT